MPLPNSCNNIMRSAPRLAPMHFGRTVSKRAWRTCGPNAIQVWSWTACSQCILLESCISSFAGTVNVLVLYSSKTFDSCGHTNNVYIYTNKSYINIYHISCSCFGIGCWVPLWTWNLRIISNQSQQDHNNDWISLDADHPFMMMRSLGPVDTVDW